MAASKAAWIMINGPVPSGLHVCHTCDNRICCNPSHLWLGTPTDNVRDCIEKGRRGILPVGAQHKRPCAKVTPALVAIARKMHEAGRTPSEIQSAIGLSRKATYAITHRQSWTHLP